MSELLPSVPSPAVQAPPAAPLFSAKRRALRRRGAAGGTMFVVAMTLAVLSTIGAWALQSAALEVRMAGYERQSTQTHYLAEYGVIAVMQDVSPTGNATQQILNTALCGSNGTHAACASIPCINFSTSPVSALAGCTEITSVLPVAKSCFRWEGATSVGAPLDVGDGGLSGVPGSLGATSTIGNISAEITELVDAPPTSGNSTSCTQGGMCSYWVTVTSYGQTSTAAGATSQGTEQLRARLAIGPIPTINLGQCL